MRCIGYAICGVELYRLVLVEVVSLAAVFRAKRSIESVYASIDTIARCIPWTRATRGDRMVFVLSGLVMSLTNYLKTPGSPVRAYLDGVSPWLADTQGRSREALSSAQALGLAELASSRTIVPPRPDVSAARSGTAVDFRARVALGGFDPHGSVAAQGVALLPLHADELDKGRHRVSVLSEAFDVAAQILDASSENVELDRSSLVLACCEQVYRAGAPALAGSLGDALNAAEDGLAFALGIDGSALADLRALMEANVSQLDAWRDRIAAGELFEPNPSFAGSALVGGADADWIVGDTLIDRKADAKITVSALRGFLRQLLGYVMLDLDDALGIRRVGIWLPRQGLTKSWSLDRLRGGDSDELLPKLRDGFRNATESTQLAVRERVTQRGKHQILAENKHTPRRMLIDLALSDDVDIRFRVGQNTKTPEETVRALAQEGYAKAREGVARNERAPIDVLEELSHDRSNRVRRAVAANPHAPKGRAKAIAVGRAEQHRPQRDALTEAVLVPAGLADDPLQIHQDRDDDALDTKWFDDFLTVALGGGLWGHGSRLPVPKSSTRWARQEGGRSLDVPNWLAAGLPDAVRADPMREHRPAWVRRRVAQSLPISDPAVRDRLLSDPDPEIRWSALRR